MTKKKKSKKQPVAIISGSGGFIGRNLAGILIEKGYKVAGVPRGLLMQPEVLEVWLKEANPELIFHLASYGNHFDQKDDNETFAANVVKTYMMLKASIEVPYKAFINISTSSVYGKKDVSMKEEMTLDTDTFYGCTKVCGEYLVKAFAKKYKKPIINVRPFSVYGPGEARFRFIPKVVGCMETGEKFILAPGPVHDWVYIEDFIDGLFTVVENVGKLRGKSINIGTGVQTSNKDIVAELIKIGGKHLEIEEMKSDRGYDSGNWKADTKLIKSLGWKPKFTLKKGLKKTYEYYELPEREMTTGDIIDESLKMSGQEGFK